MTTVVNVYSGDPDIVYGPEGLVFHPTDPNILFVVNSYANTISQINPNLDNAGVVLEITNNVLSNPTGITVDSAGNLYVSNYSRGGDFITKLVPTGGIRYSCTILTLNDAVSDSSYALSSPQGITFDSAGILYVANADVDNYISKLVLDSDTTYLCTTLTLIDAVSDSTYALSSPRGITFDSTGNLYVANANDDYISKLVLDSDTTYLCTTLTLIEVVSGSPYNLSNPVGITFDSNTGNLFVANFTNSANGTVVKIVLSGTNDGTVSPYISSGLSGPTYIVFNSDKYLYVSDQSSDSIVKTTSPSCFNHDTKIMCLNKEFQEEYLPIQDLRKGDIVKTYLHGYRKIDSIGKGSVSNKPHIWHACMYKMEKTDTNGLFEDLIVTGGHSILVDQVTEQQENAYELLGFKGIEKIDEKCLLLAAVSNEFIQLTDDEIYTYYHLVPENNGDDNQRFGIWANGILSETPSKNQFLNHKYQDM